MHDGRHQRGTRVFFALWPDAPALAATAALARAAATHCGGDATPAERIHLTLAFLGNQPDDVVEALKARMPAIAETIAPFAIAFDHVGGWRKSGVAWLAPRAAPPSLPSLNTRIVEALRPLLSLPEERAYAPHVTLARRAQTALRMAPAEPIVWRIEAFSLVASLPGGAGPSYRQIAEWALGASIATVDADVMPRP